MKVEFGWVGELGVVEDVDIVRREEEGNVGGDVGCGMRLMGEWVGERV